MTNKCHVDFPSPGPTLSDDVATAIQIGRSFPPYENGAHRLEEVKLSGLTDIDRSAGATTR